MSKVGNFFTGIRTFWGTTEAELNRCAWRGHAELWHSPWVVVLSGVLVGGFIALCDIVLRLCVKIIFRA